MIYKYFQVFILTSLLISCSDTTKVSNADKGPVNQDEEKPVTDHASFKLIAYTDPNENAFSVKFPEGWSSRASLERFHGQVRNCGVSTSPDGNTRIFFGDPSIPMFSLPVPEFGFTEGMQFSPANIVMNYVPSEKFFTDYARMAFGKHKDFRIISVEPNNKLKDTYDEQSQKLGIQSTASASSVNFEYTENNKNYTGVINGVTVNMGSIWYADLNGFTSLPSKKQETSELLQQVTSSFTTNPAWRENENQMAMQRSTQQHNQRMNDLNANAQAHQRRMQDLQSTYDANNNAWKDRQASSDIQHRKTIDMIRGEEQVTNGMQSGKVEAGYNHYYVNPHTNQYFGTNSQPQSVPEDYSEWKIE